MARHLPPLRNALRMRARACLRVVLPGFLSPCLLLPAAAAAQVSENLEYTYYDVDVRPGQALAPQIRAATPIRTAGTPFFARTDWHVQWRWAQQEPGTCHLVGLRVEVRTRILLPRLRGASAQQAAAFERYMPALREHEMGHHRIGMEAAREIESALRKLPSQRDCAAVAAQANGTAQRILESQRDKERQYDRDTGHGKSQGAWLEG